MASSTSAIQLSSSLMYLYPVRNKASNVPAIVNLPLSVECGDLAVRTDNLCAYFKSEPIGGHRAWCCRGRAESGLELLDYVLSRCLPALGSMYIVAKLHETAPLALASGIV